MCPINHQEEAIVGRVQNLFAYKIFLFKSIPQDYCGMKRTLANTYLPLSADETLAIFSNMAA